MDGIAGIQARIQEIESRFGAKPTGGGVLGTSSAGTSPSDVNAALVSGGVRVEALIPERDTLEDVFLHLVEGVDVPR